MLDIDIDASNVVGLGSGVVACDLINSISAFSNLKVKNIYLPPINLCTFSSDLETSAVLHFSRTFIPRRLQRLISLLFTPRFLRFSKRPLLVLGDIPYRVSRHQVVLFHNYNLLDRPVLSLFSPVQIYHLIRFYLLLFNLRFAESILVQNSYVANSFSSLFPRSSKLLKVFPHVPFYQVQKFASSRPQLSSSFNLNHLNLYYPASPYAHKNHKLISSLRPDKLTFVHTISCTFSKSDLPSLSSPLINYLGSLSYVEALNYYTKVDALLFLSFKETLGIPLIEAMFLSLPIVCPDKQYARRLCGDGAFYFDPNSPSSLESALIRLHEMLLIGWKPDWTSQLESIKHNHFNHLSILELALQS